MSKKNEESLKSMINAVPCCVFGYDAEELHIMSCISHSSRIGALQGLCARVNLQRKGQEDWPGPRFPASIEEVGTTSGCQHSSR